MFQRSTNQGGPPSAANPPRQPPGTDLRGNGSRGATVDSTSGPGCTSSFYEPGTATTGDLTETMYVLLRRRGA